MDLYLETRQALGSLQVILSQNMEATKPGFTQVKISLIKLKPGFPRGGELGVEHLQDDAPADFVVLGFLHVGHLLAQSLQLGELGVVTVPLDEQNPRPQRASDLSVLDGR